MYNQLKSKGHDKPLITTYVPIYDPQDDPDGRVAVPYQMNFDRFIPEGAIFFMPGHIDNYKTLTEPLPARFYSAHFAFTSGQFVKEVPHDPNFYFHGEEISIGVRAFTWGYDLFHPHKTIVWHEYTRKGRTKQWDDDSTWGKRNEESHKRNRKLFEMDGEIKDIDFGIYDFGKIRSLSDYEKYAGISFKKRAIQKYTLDNQYPPNPYLSDEEFEKSFMTIFKHCIDIHKSSFPQSDYDFWAVIFEDENGLSLNRKDLLENEIKSLLNISGDFVKLWRTFETIKKPSKWVVWPHSKSIGWCNKLEGKL
jgi:hypothetical protein